MRVIVTGATGFVGRELISVLAERADLNVVAATSNAAAAHGRGRVLSVKMPNIALSSEHDGFQNMISGADIVVHLAALTPASGNTATSEDFNVANVDAVEHLARAAVKNNVKRFVFMSSSRVSGATTQASAISEASPDAPDDVYAVSKLHAEAAILRVLENSGTAWTIIRPPLIYGPGAKGSLLQLVRAVLRGVPLPFGSITTNRRDMIGVHNIAKFIEICLEHPGAANQRFVICDGETLSTRKLVELIAKEASRPIRLLPIPAPWLRFAGKMTGKSEMLDRIIGNFQINDALARGRLDWRGGLPVQHDFQRMVHFLRRNPD